MIIIMNHRASDEQIDGVVAKLKELELGAHVSRGVERTVIGAIGDEYTVHKDLLESLPGVENVIRVQKPYKIVARSYHEANTVVDVKGIPIGGRQVQDSSIICGAWRKSSTNATAIYVCMGRLASGPLAFSAATSTTSCLYYGLCVRNFPRSCSLQQILIPS